MGSVANAKPDFLIIGAQKAGTSSLYAWLIGHPDVVSAREKELHYFDRRIATEPIDAYWADFPREETLDSLRRERGRMIVTGEATPVYLFHPSVPELVRRHLPDVRLIVLLRDPVERAVSHYWMEFNRHNETLPLAEALEAEIERTAPDLERIERGEPPGRYFWTATYTARGDYADQLERWQRLFPSEQMSIQTFENLVADPEAVYRASLEFVGVDADAAPIPRFQAERVGSKQPTEPAILDWLHERFLDSNRRLAELTGIDYRVEGRDLPRSSTAGPRAGSHIL